MESVCIRESVRDRFVRKAPLFESNIMDTDSYKLSHWVQYPKDTQGLFGYQEARGGRFSHNTLFGLQYLVHKYLTQPLTVEDVESSNIFAKKHGLIFNYADFKYMAERYGCFPIRIRAIPEGLVIPVSNATMTVESLDPRVPWVESWVETQLMRLWGPSTVAMASREAAKVCKRYLMETSDTPDQDLLFMLHDFGSRGVTCREQARLLGAAHLLNFRGSDTIVGIEMVNHYYDCDMAAWSVIAAEHSTITSWGESEELDAYMNFVQTALIDREVPPGMLKIAACVSDSYNIFDATRMWCSDPLRSMVKGSGGRIVIRPDSGNPIKVLREVFGILGELLKDEITYVKGGKYRLLPNWIRVIQGDGINPLISSIDDILAALTADGWSASNICFGSGGGLLQCWNRDDQEWAFKASAVNRGGQWRPVRKNPITSSKKRSKAGRLDLVLGDNGYETKELPDGQIYFPNTVMNTVLEYNNIMAHYTMDECRGYAAI